MGLSSALCASLSRRRLAHDARRSQHLTRCDSPMCFPVGLFAPPSSVVRACRLRSFWVLAVRAVANSIAAVYRQLNKTRFLYNSRKRLLNPVFFPRFFAHHSREKKQGIKPYEFYIIGGCVVLVVALGFRRRAPVARGGLCVGVSSAPRLSPCACALRAPRPPPLK